MRYAVISDIHGNLQALEAVLNECRHLNVGAFLCAGDIVGYGGNPKECLGLVRKIKAVSVAGNHDWAVSGRLDYSYFTPDGQAAVTWTRTRIGFEDIAYLNNLPLILKDKDLIVAHGTPNDPKQFIYLANVQLAAESFTLMDASVCFVGHTHKPQVFVQRNGQITQLDVLDLEVHPEFKYIINVGSIGQPRDGNPLASFCIYDTGSQLVEHHRVSYDIKKAQHSILEAGLPETLAMRLAQGR